MTPEAVMTVAYQSLSVTALLAAPLLLSALATGLLIGILQAATQINEMTLSFIPKLLVLVVALMAAGRWMLTTIMTYTEQLFAGIPALVG